MAHHKRKGPKSTRAGCLLCKPYKRQGFRLPERQRFSQTRRIAVCREQVVESTGARRSERRPADAVD